MFRKAIITTKKWCILVGVLGTVMLFFGDPLEEDSADKGQKLPWTWAPSSPSLQAAVAPSARGATCRTVYASGTITAGDLRRHYFCPVKSSLAMRG